MHGQWWNFNSLFPAPQQLSQFYLSAFLATLREQGYSIFVVHGDLPTYPDTSVTGDQGAWLTEAQVLPQRLWYAWQCSHPPWHQHDWGAGRLIQ